MFSYRRKARVAIHFATVLLGLTAMRCIAQPTPDKLLQPSDLQADVAILRAAYENLHPGLYRYNTKPQMDAAFAALNQRLAHQQSLPDAFLAFSQFAAKVRCGHTQANPFNQSKVVVESLLKTPIRVPFYFQWLDRRMIVTEDFTPDHALPRGTEILQVNGHPAPAILDNLMTITRADGSNDAKRIAQLAVTGDSKFETFDIYFPLFFPTTDPRVDVVIRRPGTPRAQHLHLVPLSYEQRISPIKQREDQRNGGNSVLFEWKYLSRGIAYLKMPTWALYNSKWDWKGWLNEKLDEAADRNSPALILDLRGNEGGNDVGNEIISHLIDSPLQLTSLQRLVRYRKVPEDLLPYLDTWDKTFRDWGTSAQELPVPWPTAPPVHYFVLVRDGDENEVITPAGHRYRGQLILLVDAANSSATFQFAHIIQSHHLGTLVGQTTGGSQRGINGGAFFFLRLPHSGIEMDVPLIGTFPPASAADSGITPDIVVKRTVADIRDAKDPELSAALALVK